MTDINAKLTAVTAKLEAAAARQTESRHAQDEQEKQNAELRARLAAADSARPDPEALARLEQDIEGE